MQALVDVVRRIMGCEPLVVSWREADALRDVQNETVGYVVLGTGEDDAREVLDELSRRPADLPLVVVGDDPCKRARPTCWLRTLPTPSVLGALLTHGGSGEWSMPSAALPSSAPGSFRRKSDMIVGTSAAVRQLLQALDRVGPSSAPVMISGESGTGKELVARALHFGGPRANEPFIAINCAAIPEPLFEAELFGYQRGAFTGAIASRMGAFESAHKGTLFLDEIGELPLPLQPKLLRVLETGTITRLGTTETRNVAVRVVAATNRNLEEEVARGRFREDLYYRLRVFPLVVPPLRSRPEDIPAIVNHHLALIAAREKRPVPALTAAALERLVHHGWRGNVRELVNTLERAFVLANPIDVQHIDLPASSGVMPAVGGLVPYRDAKAHFEAEYYTQLMRLAGGNVTLASRLSKKTRKEIYDALKRLGLEAAAYRSSVAPEPGDPGDRGDRSA